MDSEIGRLLADLTEPTTVFFVGDNGSPGPVTVPPFDSSRAKSTLYEGGLNVPLIVRDAFGRSPNTESAALVHTVDLFTTIMDQADVGPPPGKPIDGLSLDPLLEDPATQIRDVVYSELPGEQTNRNERFKLIRRSAQEEFYDLEGDPPSDPGDPFEQVNLLAGTLSPVEQSNYEALGFEMDTLLTPAGRVPDGAELPGTPLTVTLEIGGEITLSWGASCSTDDVDFEVYEGTLGDFTSHQSRLCTTGGATSATLAPSAGDAYYLVVPNNGSREGSYGSSSDGTQRPPSAAPCLPQSFPGCE
jgi:hypothetical protein